MVVLLGVLDWEDVVVGRLLPMAMGRRAGFEDRVDESGMG